MSDDFSAEKSAGGVSPARKKISALILCGLAIVLIIEVRAGMGHMLSGKMLQEKSPDGVFEALTLDEFEPLLSLAPSRTTIREDDEEIEYRYAWFSLLRPLLSRPEAAYYIVASKSTPSQVQRYNTEAPTEEELAAAKRAAEFSGEETEMSPEAAAFTAMATGGGDGPGDGGPGGGGPPPQDPTVTMLDKDSDGELSEEELEGASAALLAADKNGDGTLTADELRPAGGRGGGGERRRPPIDTSDEEEAAPSEDDSTDAAGPAPEPVEPKADDSPDDAPEKTEEKTESEKAPAAEKPASE